MIYDTSCPLSFANIISKHSSLSELVVVSVLSLIVDKAIGDREVLLSESSSNSSIISGLRPWRKDCSEDSARIIRLVISHYFILKLYFCAFSSIQFCCEINNISL